MNHPTLVGALGGAILALCASSTHAVVDLSFGLYTSNKPTAMVKQFRPVLDAVEDRLEAALDEPVNIRIQVARDYSQGIDHLATGKVDFSRFGPASYIEAKRANAGLRILAMEREDGDKVFYGVIAVADDSGIYKVEDLRGGSFAFGSDQSTIGRYLSQLYLRNHGIYAADLSRFDYLDRHDKVGTAVGAGHFDAGALNESTYKQLVAGGVGIREIARFPNVTKPWIARAGLPDRVFKALQNALLDLDEPKALKALKKDGFILGDDTDYAAIRTAIENNGEFFELPGSLAESVVPGAESGPSEPDRARIDESEDDQQADSETSVDAVAVDALAGDAVTPAAGTPEVAPAEPDATSAGAESVATPADAADAAEVPARDPLAAPREFTPEPVSFYAPNGRATTRPAAGQL